MSQGHQGGERLIERPWLQLMCCAPVSSREVGRVFRSEGSRQDRGLLNHGYLPGTSLWTNSGYISDFRTQ